MDLSSHEGDIPIPISSSTYIGAQSHGHSFLSSSNGPPPHHHHHHHHHPPPPPPPTEDHHHQAIVPKKPAAVVKYRECLKNHAASIGGNATDGCGEFMPSGEEGTLEALKCSACGCHRNFHRKETEGDPFGGGSPSCDCRRNFIVGHGHKGVLIPRPTPHSMIMPLGAASAMQTSESDEMAPRPPLMKKRFRTKFSAEQKEKMLAFAERAGWKLQKQEEGVVQRFCQEIGVKRRVLKVWMHNNKHNLAKKEPLANNNSGFNNSERVSSFNSERAGERMSE